MGAGVVNVDLSYLGHSRVADTSTGTSVTFAPNLARPKVFYDAQIRHPLRFREAMSALHEVVVGDLTFKKKDKTGYRAWKADEARREQALQADLFKQMEAAELGKGTDAAIPPDLESRFRSAHSVYWTARRAWAWELQKNDPELFRHLVPCDPVVTVAPDAVLFECFARDESSYGCLSVSREGFTAETGSGSGTTNVDYSLALYEHFQTLRTYRATRLVVDPTGFEVKVHERSEHREEKIDLPGSWLRGFGQLQAAMALPTQRVGIAREAIYSVLIHLARHREKTGPRSIRFKLDPGRVPVMVLEPWGLEISCGGAPWAGARSEEVKVWGRRRLSALTRLLPLAESIEVLLLGTGLPSLWVVTMGEMRFTLALSGWTANDWTAGSNLELLSGKTLYDANLSARIERWFGEHRRGTEGEVRMGVGSTDDVVTGTLHRLAKQGQVMFDVGAGVYRWRPMLSVALSETMLGPESPELVASRELFAEGRVQLTRQDALENGRVLLEGRVGATVCEALLTSDDAFARGSCNCSHYFRFKLRAGPCRHLLALRFAARAAQGRQGGVA